MLDLLPHAVMQSPLGEVPSTTGDLGYIRVAWLALISAPKSTGSVRPEMVKTRTLFEKRIHYD